MDNWQEKIDDVFEELKDFQKETVEFAYTKLIENGRYLVADEVGLGKTKIAKGIIAKALKEFMDKKSSKPYRVFYICSNQALANQNLKDLNIFKDSKFINPDLNRLIYLAKNKETNQRFSLSSLTPSTSFKITSGTGHQDERKLIYTVLTKTEEFSEKGIQRGLKWLLLGTVENWEDWQERIDVYQQEFRKDIVLDLPEKYLKKLRNYKLKNGFEDCIKEVCLSSSKPTNLLELLLLYVEQLSLKRSVKTVKKEFYSRNKLLVHLRRILIDVSLENLNADLFILDEFQRFKELVNMGQDQNSEAAQLAKKVFSIKGAKCLMLSATPFKPYTTQFEELENENHYDELLKLLKFLFNNDETKIKEFEKQRKLYNRFLKNMDTSVSETIETKVILEKIYKSVLCRTEKLLVSNDKNSIVISKDEPDLETFKIDLENFIHTDRTFQTLIKKYQKSIKYSIDYNKSVPFPLSFMDGYQSKKHLLDFISENLDESSSLLKKHNNAWLKLDQVQDYKLKEVPNAKFRKLIKESVEDNDLWKLLWLPPSLPYYSGMGVYQGKENLSKVLIFSKWVMVPKMIAGLVSYDIERRTIGNATYFPELNAKYTVKVKKQADREENEEGDFGRRKPLPILRLQRKGSNAVSMRSFTLLYSSKTLCDLLDNTFNISSKCDYKDKRTEYIDLVENSLNSLRKYEDKNASIDKNWYWAASILLDKTFNSIFYDKWIDKLNYHPITKRETANGEKVNQAAKAHLEEIQRIYKIIEFEGLGSMPEDLAKILVDIALGSPANCIYKCLRRYFNDEDSISEILNYSLELGYDFMLFFDKPESIAAVQINEQTKDNRFKDNRDKTDIHWNLVLRYCIDGNLQSVIDEYSHMLFSKNRTVSDLATAIASGLNLRTSSVKVEGLDKKNILTNKNLRCHYAVSFGNQNLETEEGKSRASDVINNFNSPFRPFVLASTSLGQEGLDFHYYCRKIMHWNLPHSPVEFEQREGRINRFKGLVIRQNLSHKYKSHLQNHTDIWEELFNIALEKESTSTGKPQILPFWYTESQKDIKIERIVPLFPLSKDVTHYKEMISLLTLYRLTFGQPRQEELLKSFKDLGNDKEKLTEIYDKYLLNLSPIKLSF
jgi:hypothetical protein